MLGHSTNMKVRAICYIGSDLETLEGGKRQGGWLLICFLCCAPPGLNPGTPTGPVRRG